MNAKFLRVEMIGKIFNPGKENEVVGLRDINLEIGQGEFVVLSGPSGSGKTTLLNIIGGLDSPSSGEVQLGGLRITGLKERDLARERRDHIGFVFQAYNLIAVLTARENIEFIMKLQKRSHVECVERVNEVAKKLGIGEILEKLPNQMSGGQQQRVAVARAVASKPQLILADEPTANLDSKTANELMDMMLELNQDEGVTIILSSHDPLVISKARHHIVLKDGEIIRDACLA